MFEVSLYGLSVPLTSWWSRLITTGPYNNLSLVTYVLTTMTDGTETVTLNRSTPYLWHRLFLACLSRNSVERDSRVVSVGAGLNAEDPGSNPGGGKEI